MQLSSGDDRRPPPITALPVVSAGEPAPPPAPLTPIIGRDAEVQAVVSRFDDGVRLQTLTGPGGVGKTRVAIRAGDEFAVQRGTSAFVVFVALAHVREAASVAGEIADAVGLRGHDHRPLPVRIRAAAEQRDLLLILDNFEQVVDATGLVRELLEGCQRLRVLITSRVRLCLAGEHVFMVSPLALPALLPPDDFESVTSSPAVRLFIDRAAAARPGFALTAANAASVAAICRKLDGLPLALELAAAKIALFSPRELLDQLHPSLLSPQLDDGQDRTNTVRSAVGWSYDALDTGEQTLFRALAVFAGGSTLAAVAAVAGSDGQDGGTSGILPGIERLVAASLIQRADTADGETTRLAMLETIQAYGLERAEEHAELEELRRRHAGWFQCLATEVDSHMERPDLDRWWPLLAADHDNVRAAFDWLESTGQHDDVLSFAASLWRFWFHDGHIAEGSARLKRALRVGGSGTSAHRCEVLTGAAMLAHFQGADDDAVRFCQEAWALLPVRAPGSLPGRIWYTRGLIDEDAGAFATAGEHFARALDAFVQANDQFWICAAQTHLGIAAIGTGELETATRILAEVLEAQRAAGFGWETARTLLALAQATIARGELDAVRPLLVEALGRAIEQGAPRSLTHDTVATVALLAARAGAPPLAARLGGWASGERERAGTVPGLPERSLFAAGEEAVRSALGVRQFSEEWERGRLLPWAMVAEQAAALVSQSDAAVELDNRVSVGSSGLTRRETDVLRLLSRRLTDKEIAEELGLSPRTVMHHVSNVLGKLGVSSRRDAATWAQRQGVD